MVVELAVLIPVVIAVALIAYNLVRFAALSASFDRIAADAVISQGVSPSGEQSSIVAIDEVRACIEQSMHGDPVEVEVLAESVSAESVAVSGEVSFPLSPLLTRFICTMSYRPWPQISFFAGVGMGTPVTLTHERMLVVDRFRAGVVA